MLFGFTRKIINNFSYATVEVFLNGTKKERETIFVTYLYNVTNMLMLLVVKKKKKKKDNILMLFPCESNK